MSGVCWEDTLFKTRLWLVLATHILLIAIHCPIANHQFLCICLCLSYVLATMWSALELPEERALYKYFLLLLLLLFCWKMADKMCACRNAQKVCRFALTVHASPTHVLKKSLDFFDGRHCLPELLFSTSFIANVDFRKLVRTFVDFHKHFLTFRTIFGHFWAFPLKKSDKMK